jgi:hypothetical protein
MDGAKDFREHEASILSGDKVGYLGENMMDLINFYHR